jgi:thymidylate synthase ThyX
MSFSVQIIADSINTASPNRERITTFLCTFPRYILAEVNTHRMFSRNSASSRAIPFRKMVEAVKTNSFIPIAWQKDHSGMQGTEYHTSGVPDMEDCWLRARDAAVERAEELNSRQATKQLCNRLLEPFMWHTALITATEWENFFALRCPQYWFSGKYWRSRQDIMKEYADLDTTSEELQKWTELDWLKINKGQGEIHIMKLAEMMWDALNESTPRELKAGEWHIPFGDQISVEALEEVNRITNTGDYFKEQTRLKIATARCAQTSYTLIGDEDKPMDYTKLIALHDRLAQSGHWSPFEHCARAMNEEQYQSYVKGVGDLIEHPAIEQELVLLDDAYKGWYGNFRGFIQYRKMFPNENHTVK